MATSRTVFGVERKIEIPDDSITLSESEIKVVEERCGENCEHGWFDSCVGGAKLHYRKWLPSGGKPKAIIVHAHGIRTHSGNALIMPDGRKYNVSIRAEKLNEEGYALYAFDAYGHGYSEGTRWLIPGWKTNVADYCTFVNLVASQHEDSIPLFLMGESYGAGLSIHLARQFQDHPETGPKNLDSIILTSSAIKADLPPRPIVWAFRYILAPLAPRWVPFFMPNTVGADRIWRDPEIRELKMNDPQKKLFLDAGGEPFRLGTATNLLSATEEVYNTSIPGFTVPFCLIHGTSDYATPIEGAEHLWATAETPAADKEFHRMEGAYHDMYADPEHTEKAIEIINKWIKKRIEA